MARTTPLPPEKQRDDLLDSARNANRDEQRNFKEDALKDKSVHVNPDGTGPTSTETFDAPADEQRGSGNPTEGKGG
jgi:hypothetical protein